MQNEETATFGFLSLALAILSFNYAIAARGNLCLYCDRISIPQDCSRVIRCGAHEDCYVEKFVSPDGIQYYSVGCRDILKCTGVSINNGIGKRTEFYSLLTNKTDLSSINSHTQEFDLYKIEKELNLKEYGSNLKKQDNSERGVVQEDSGDISVCSACCNNEICNVQSFCGSPKPDKHNGTICFKCDNMEKPAYCREITLCSPTESCFVQQVINSFSKRILHNSGCKPDDQCRHQDDSTGCCKNDLCNDNLPCNVKVTNKPKLHDPYIDTESSTAKFNCTFEATTNRFDVMFKVTWMVDSDPLTNEKGEEIYQMVTRNEKIAYLDIDRLKNHMNKLLRCKVQAVCNADPNPGEAAYSGGYWVGVRASSLRIGHERRTNITIESTIPIYNQDMSLGLPFLMLQEDRKGDTTSLCTYSFTYRPSDKKYVAIIPVSLRAHSNYIKSDSLVFKTMENFNFPAFMWYNPPPLQIGAVRSIENFTQCSLIGARLKLFDGTYVNTLTVLRQNNQNLLSAMTMDNSSDVDLVLFKSEKAPYLEIQARRKACKSGICTCAIIIKENNDVLKIDVCGQTGHLIPVVTRLANKSRMAIQETDDGLNIMVTPFSGSNISVSMLGPDTNMNINLSLVKTDLGEPGGACGNATFNGGVLGLEIIQQAYLNRWMVPNKSSLFEQPLIVDPAKDPDVRYCYCRQDTKEVVCGALV